MAQIPKEQRKHDNLAAQVMVMKGELDSVNRELSIKLKEKDSLKNELLSLANKIGEQNKQIRIATKWVDSKIEELSNKEINLQDREVKLDKSEKESKDRKILEEKLHREKIQEYSVSISNIKTISITCQDELNNLLVNVDNGRDILVAINKEIKKLSKDESDINGNIDRMRKELSEEVSDFDKQIVRKEKKLKEINEEILRQQQLIEAPTRSLELAEIELNRKRKNLDVLIMRFKKYIKRYFPNQEIKL